MIRPLPRYSNYPRDPAGLLRALRSHRDLMAKAGHEIGYDSPLYKRAHEITAAIDGMAELLTGDRGYLWLAARSIPTIAKEPPKRD